MTIKTYDDTTHVAVLRETSLDARSWEEDKSHENGNYFNTCGWCNRQFVGHKRRFTCKQCATAAPEHEVVQQEPEYIVTWLDGICCVEPISCKTDYPAEFTELFTSPQPDLTAELEATIAKQAEQIKVATEALEKCRNKIQFMINHGEWYAPEKTVASADDALAKLGAE